jgi:putative addiction module component (TIGR02574 family)
VDLKGITDIALSLPVEERARLVRQLLESLDTLPSAEVEQLWLEEAARRADQIDRGAVKLVPADEVLARACALLK